MPAIPKQSLPSGPLVLPDWTERTLIFRFPCGTVHAAHGWWYGSLAVHAALPQERDTSLVVVSHIPSRIAVMRLTETEDAVAAVEYLWKRCHAAFVKPDEAVDKSKIPTDVVQWIKECNRLKRFVK